MHSHNHKAGPITATDDSFQWPGGAAALTVVGNFTASLEVTLQKLGPDDTTWVDVVTLTDEGRTIQDLETGTYRIELAVGTSTGLYYEVTRILT